MFLGVKFFSIQPRDCFQTAKGTEPSRFCVAHSWLTFKTGTQFSTSREDSRTKIRYVVANNNMIVDSGGLLGTEKQQVRDYLNGIHEFAELATR